MKKENNQEFYVEQMDVHYPLQSEIQNEIEAKASLLGDWSPCCALCERRFLLVETATDRTPYRRLCRF